MTTPPKKSDDSSNTIDDIVDPTPVTTYFNDDTNKTVTFIGATHLGSKQYFEEIYQLSQNTDVFLYELIASEEGSNTPEMYKHFAYIMTKIILDEYKKDSRTDSITTRLDREIVVQTDGGLPYDNPPKHWKLSDISEQRAKEILKKYTTRKLPENLSDEEKMNAGLEVVSEFLAELNLERENRLMGAFDAVLLNNGVDNVTIYYGKDHQPAIEKELKEKGYKKIKEGQLFPVKPIIKDVLNHNYEQISSYVMGKMLD